MYFFAKGYMMNIRKLLRIISLIMLIIAVIFVICALSSPTLGNTIYIGNFTFGAEQWRICYVIYVIIMLGLFAISFFIKKKSNE